MEQREWANRVNVAMRNPEVIAALEVLLVNGLMSIPRTGKVFCAYCGADIIQYAVGAEDLIEIRAAVHKHRVGCEAFQDSLPARA